MTDFDLFHPDRMASRILDMGDMLTLIEQAEKTFDQEQAAKAAAKLTGQGGEFTLDDFLEQMQQVRKLGSMSKIMGMLPGMGQFRDQLEISAPGNRETPSRSIAFQTSLRTSSLERTDETYPPPRTLPHRPLQGTAIWPNDSMCIQFLHMVLEASADRHSKDRVGTQDQNRDRHRVVLACSSERWAPTPTTAPRTTRSPTGVTIGGVDVGGMDAVEAKRLSAGNCWRRCATR